MPAEGAETSAGTAPGPQAATTALRALLRALAHAEVQALVLTTGELVQVERGERRAPLTQRPLGEAQIEALLAPTGLFVALGAHAGAQLEHPFVLDGQPYLATAMRGPAGLRIRVVRVMLPPADPSSSASLQAGADGAAGGSEAAVHAALQDRVAAFGAAQQLGVPPRDASAVAAAALRTAEAAPAAPEATRPTSAGAPVAPVEAPAEAGRRPVAAPAVDDAAPPPARRAYQAVSVPRPNGRAQAAGEGVPPPPLRTAHVPAAAAPRPLAPPSFGIAVPFVAALAPAAVAAAEVCRANLAAARAAGASDVHLSGAQRPRWRRGGALGPEGEPVPEAALTAFIASVLPDAVRARLESTGYADFACSPPGVGRLRANVSQHSGGLKLCARLLPEAPLTLEQLGLPPQLAAVAHFHQGLAVISGPQGHGKSTTLAAIVDGINAERDDHVVCIEDPIEILYPRKRALISQREVGGHTRSFARAIKASLREDPDVIVIGELRDREAVEMALSAAETGHLVLTTMNTRSAAKTIDRLIDMFPPGDQPQVRAALAGALKMIVSQRLLVGPDGQRVAAAEVVAGCPPLSALIRDNKLVQLPTLQQRGQQLGMLLLDQSLAELVRAGKVTLAVALAACEQPAELQRRVAAPGGAATTAAPGAPVGRATT